MEIEGVTLDELKSMPAEEVDILLRFGRPITFHMGSANILAEFNTTGDELLVNLAHIDGGGEGVLALLWKAIMGYAAERNYRVIQWNIHALTCANPNPRLQQFLRGRGFTEIDHEVHGRVLMLRQEL